MARFVKGDVVVVPFPFSDLTRAKRHPANVRLNRIFTADCHIVLYRIGHLKPDKISKVTDKIVDILRQ